MVGLDSGYIVGILAGYEPCHQGFRRCLWATAPIFPLTDALYNHDTPLALTRSVSELQMSRAREGTVSPPVLPCLSLGRAMRLFHGEVTSS